MHTSITRTALVQLGFIDMGEVGCHFFRSFRSGAVDLRIHVFLVSDIAEWCVGISQANGGYKELVLPRHVETVKDLQEIWRAMTGERIEYQKFEL